MKVWKQLFTLVVLLISSCTAEWEMDGLMSAGASKTLKINVQTNAIESKAMYTEQFLPSESEIGVTVLNTSGYSYGGKSYQNVKYTASGSKYAQTWSGASEFSYLSGSDGYCYAYYPYNSSVSSIKSIPLTTDGTDYMYATPVLVNDNNPYASLVMNHALAVIQLQVKRGSYTGTGEVTSLSVSGSKLGNSGTLDASTGAVSPSGLNNSITQSVSFTLGSTAKSFDFFVVTKADQTDLTFSVTVDGKTYSYNTSAGYVIQKGVCHQFTVTVDAAELGVVSDGFCEYNASGTPVITSGWNKVTFEGNYKNIGFRNSVGSDGTVTIQAMGFYNYPPKSASISGKATLSQSVSGIVRTITLQNITSNVTLTFDGTEYPFEDDGVYALKSDGTAVIASVATDDSYAAIVVAYNGKPYQIAKTDANGGSSFAFGTIPAEDKSLFPFYTKPYASHSYSNGYLRKPDGTYGSSSNRLSSTPTDWSGGSMEEFNGKSRTAYLLEKQGTSTSNTIGYVVAQFNSNGSVNEGYNDWFVPSMGELGYIYTKWADIKGLVSKVSGFTDFSSSYYDSSSCYSTTWLWCVNFSNGYVDYMSRSSNYYVRLVRSL